MPHTHTHRLHVRCLISAASRKLHLPSSPTVSGVKTVPWFHGGEGSGFRGVWGVGVTRMSARGDVRAAVCVCVCAQRKTDNLTKEREG